MSDRSEYNITYTAEQSKKYGIGSGISGTFFDRHVAEQDVQGGQGTIFYRGALYVVKLDREHKTGTIEHPLRIEGSWVEYLPMDLESGSLMLDFGQSCNTGDEHLDAWLLGKVRPFEGRYQSDGSLILIGFGEIQPHYVTEFLLVPKFVFYKWDSQPSYR